MKTRNQTEIIQNMLSISKKKVYQDKFIKSSNVSPQMFKKYELGLLMSGRITKTKSETDRRIYYETTTKGLKTLEALKKMHRIQTNILRTMKLKPESKDLNKE